MIEQPYFLLITAITIAIYTAILWVLSYKYYKLKREFKNNLDHAKRLPRIPEPEKYTIVDLIFDHEIDTMEMANVPMTLIIDQMKRRAGNEFINELEKLKGLQVYQDQARADSRTVKFRIVTKIALKDEQ